MYILFHISMSRYQFTFTHGFSMCTNTNVMVVINVSVIVYNQTWKNWFMLSLHGPLALDVD